MAEYIEKESLLKNFCGFDLTECVKYGNKTKEQACKSYDTLMMYEIADEIENAPSSDVAPVVHAHWIDCGTRDDDGNGEYICSRCDHNDKHSPGIKVPHCWFCGAYMDAEKEEPYGET